MLFTKGNRKLPKSTLIWNLPTGITCIGSTEECRKYCYAKKAERLYPQVLPFRMKNYELSKLEDFSDILLNELGNIKEWEVIRIHESGDFYSQDYLDKWIEVAKRVYPKIVYAYTKSFKLDFSKRSPNFIVIGSVDNFLLVDNIKTKGKLNGVAIIGENIANYFECPMDCKKCCYCFTNPYYYKHINFKKH